jgi:hypothetical protein
MRQRRHRAADMSGPDRGVVDLTEMRAAMTSKGAAPMCESMRKSVRGREVAAAVMATTEMSAAEMAPAKMCPAKMSTAATAEVSTATAVASTATTVTSATAPRERCAGQGDRESQHGYCNAGFRHLNSSERGYAVRFGPIASNCAFCSSLSVA